MIKMDSVIEQVGITPTGEAILKVSLEADTSAEVIANGTSTANIKGFPSNAVMGAFSDAFTADKALLILDSTGNWN